MMTEWYQKAIYALQLNGLGERTQEAYVRALRMLCEFYHKTGGIHRPFVSGNAACKRSGGMNG